MTTTLKVHPKLVRSAGILLSRQAASMREMETRERKIKAVFAPCQPQLEQHYPGCSLRAIESKGTKTRSSNFVVVKSEPSNSAPILAYVKIRQRQSVFIPSKTGESEIPLKIPAKAAFELKQQGRLFEKACRQHTLYSRALSLITDSSNAYIGSLTGLLDAISSKRETAIYLLKRAGASADRRFVLASLGSLNDLVQDIKSRLPKSVPITLKPGK
ncbi:MAG: hypothetical protein PHV13_00900 [Candidatus ainarchaeum sp.]|nr:hypothetical protein [Candidatus ainarchaeum sp.]